MFHINISKIETYKNISPNYTQKLDSQKCFTKIIQKRDSQKLFTKLDTHKNDSQKETHKKGNCNKFLTAVFHLVFIIIFLVLSIESVQDFAIAALFTFVLQYQNLGLIQCLKLKEL